MEENMKKRKYFAGILICILSAASMPALAAEPMPETSKTGFIFSNTKGLLYTDTLVNSEADAVENPGNDTIKKTGTDTAGAGGDATFHSCPSIDYDNVEMGDNMMQASVDGTEMTFYLERAGSASDGYELSYISFTPEGAPQYQIYLRIPLNAAAGSYTSGTGYFSISTSYNEENGKWGSSYKALYNGNGKEGVHGSSSFSGNWGSYRLTLDQDMSWEESEISGTLAATMDGFSSATSGKTISIENGVFKAVKGETHQVVQNWQSGSLVDSSSGWVDPYAGTDKQEKKVCSKCGGNGKVICSYCDGAGTILQRKESIDLGSGSTGYTVEVDCAACDNGYIQCSRCGGSGYEY